VIKFRTGLLRHYDRALKRETLPLITADEVIE